MTEALLDHTDRDGDFVRIEPQWSNSSGLFVKTSSTGAFVPRADVLAALGVTPTETVKADEAPTAIAPGNYTIAEGATNYEGPISSDDIGKEVDVESFYIDSDGDATVCEPAGADYVLGSMYVNAADLVPVVEEAVAPAKALEAITPEDVTDVEEVALLAMARQILDPTGLARPTADEILLIAEVIRKK